MVRTVDNNRLMDVLKDVGVVPEKLMAGEVVHPNVSVLVAWDEDNNCYRKVNCDSDGKLVCDMS